MPRKKVCCFCEKWESGGIESFLCNVLLRMDLTDLEVDIVAAQLGESVFTQPLKAHGVQFYELSGKPNRMGPNHRLFRKLLAERQYDVLHLNLFQGLSLAYARLARKAGVPVRIAHSHGSGLRNSLGKQLKLRLHQFGKQRWSGAITVFWACSQRAAEFLFPKGRDYQWIPNGIEVERFRFQALRRTEVRQALGLTEDQLLVGTVGRLSEEKNHGFLLEMFCELKKRRPDSVLLLVGEGRLKEELQAKAKGLGVAESVCFYGASSQVETLLWAMDGFVFPSQFEGLGIVAVEAQAAGLPVLCSTGIPPEAMVTQNVTQLPLSAGPAAWAETALQMQTSEDRAAGAAQVIAAGFEVSAVAERIRETWMER